MALLSQKYPHVRDAFITFKTSDHSYNIPSKPVVFDKCIDSNNDKSYAISVTTVVKYFFSSFDPDKVIQSMMSSNNWINSKYYGKTSDDIKELWLTNGNDASTKGTKLHHEIELFYNGIYSETSGSVTEFKLFLQFATDYAFIHRLCPYRTEWMIYDECARIAGTVDMIFKDEHTETYTIVDWKRCSKICINSGSINNHNRPKGKGIMQEFDDCNYVKYSLQLNIYRYILEHIYKLKITKALIVVIHPDNGSYITHEVYKEPMQHVIETIFEVLRTAAPIDGCWENILKSLAHPCTTHARIPPSMFICTSSDDDTDGEDNIVDELEEC